MRIKLPLIAAKQCPVCKTTKAFNAAETEAPVGWLHIQYRGADEYVCCQGCMNEVIRAANRHAEFMESTREKLPPDIVL